MYLHPRLFISVNITISLRPLLHVLNEGKNLHACYKIKYSHHICKQYRDSNVLLED